MGKKMIPLRYEQSPLASLTPWRGEARRLYDFTRRVLGKDTANYRQEVGDPLAHCAKNVVEYLQAIQIVLGEWDQPFRAAYAPYFHYTARMKVGQGRYAGNDGCTGDDMDTALRHHGILAADAPGLKPYGLEVARKWGRGVFDEDEQSPHPTPELAGLIGASAVIRSPEEAAQAVYHGYPVILASQQGYSMRPDPDGFHFVEGSWSHAMMVLAVASHWKYGAYALLLNSWGDAHGHLEDFDDRTPLPVGVLRIRWDDFTKAYMRASAESYAYSPYLDFRPRVERLDVALTPGGRIAR